MSWAKFDDLYDDNRKIKRAWRRNRAAVGLHAMAITYCARHETDGVVDIDWVEDKLPKDRERTQTLTVLIETGLFEVVDDEHWRVHDYLDYNDSAEGRAEKRAEERRRKSEAGKKGAAKRWGHGKAMAGAIGSDSSAMADAWQSKNSSIAPDPTRPDLVVEVVDAGADAGALHPQLAEVVSILAAARRPDGGSLVVEELSIHSMIRAHPNRDPVQAAHETAALVQSGGNRSSNATSVFGSVLRNQKPPAPARAAKPEPVSSYERRRAERANALKSLMKEAS